MCVRVLKKKNLELKVMQAHKNALIANKKFSNQSGNSISKSVCLILSGKSRKNKELKELL